MFFPFIKEQEKLFIIFTHRLNNQTFTEVEFSSENEDAKRVPGTLENEYTISVAAPGKYLWNYVSSLIVRNFLWYGFYLLQTCLLGSFHSPCTLTCLVSAWDLSHTTPVWEKSVGIWKRPWTPWPSSVRWDIEVDSITQVVCSFSKLELSVLSGF